MEKKNEYIKEKIVAVLWCTGLLLIAVDIILYYYNQSRELYFINLFGAKIWNDQICSSPQFYILGFFILMIGSLLFPFVFGRDKTIRQKIALLLAIIVIQGSVSFVTIILVSANISVDILPNVNEIRECQIVHEDMKLYISHNDRDLLLFTGKGKTRVKWLDSHSDVVKYHYDWTNNNFVIEIEKDQGQEVVSYSYKQLRE